MVYFNFSLTVEVLIKDILVTMVFPPLTQLPVPGTRQDMEQPLIFHA